MKEAREASRADAERRRRETGVGERFYRKSFSDADLVWYRVVVEQTDLMIGSAGNCAEEAGKAVRRLRKELEDVIRRQPSFLTSLVPVACPLQAAPIVRDMCRAAELADVGPMAAVAGAMAEAVGRGIERTMIKESADGAAMQTRKELPGSLKNGDGEKKPSSVIVENGGDIWMTGDRDRVVGVFAGASPLSGRIGVRIPAGLMPCGACTSSGTVGHSLSFGFADAAMVIAKSAALADAAASALGNRIRRAEDVEDAIDHTIRIPGVLGALAVIGEHIGAVGAVELVAL